MDGVLRPRPRAIVVGAGFGGLAAAVRLGARGYAVTLLDRLDAPGGRARTHREGGFRFDAGPTIVTAPFLLEELWALAGRRLADEVELRPLSPFYRLLFHDGSHLDHGGAEAMRAEVARLSPGDLAGYDRFAALSAEACRVGFEELGDRPFDRAADMARCAPALIRLGAWRSVHGLVARHVRDERLRIALSFHPLLIGGNPFRASGLYALIPALEARWGVHWPMGGMGRLVEGLAGLVEALGGRLRLGAEVSEIVVRDGRARGVRLASGEALPAEVVVSNADAVHTLSRLLPPGAEPLWPGARLARARHSMGVFLWHFGTSRRWPEVGHHTILLGPRYRGLLADLFDRRALPPDPSLYLHRPTATDPSAAPPGGDAFYVLAPVPNLSGATDWRREAEPFRRLVERRLEETVLPGLGASVVASRVVTPLDFRDELLASQGSGFGLEPVLTQSAWFRPRNRVPGVAGLYLVGAGTHPGAGVPGVLSSARLLDRVVPHAAALA